MYVWLSFCDPEKPEGQQFLGVAIVDAPELADPRETTKYAIFRSHALGINPGGEVAAFAVPAERAAEARPYAHRLLRRPEVERIFGPPATRAEIERMGEAVTLSL